LSNTQEIPIRLPLHEWSKETEGNTSFARPHSTVWGAQRGFNTWIRVNDPSAGSPTETLLRLLLPLNNQVCFNSRIRTEGNPTGRRIP
jgi:hypothetical protein